MRIIDLFDKYFLFLMVILTLVTIFIDAKAFERADKMRTARIARVLSIAILCLSAVLFIARVLR